jgi:hypothetical protein
MTSPAPPPRLETSRLLLREWRESDFEPHAAMCADPEVMRHLGGTIDPAESWRRMAQHAGHWALRGYGKWAVERRDTGEWIGRVGLWNPPDWPGVEVGWTLVRGAWGQGYATEAATASPMGMGESRLRTPRLADRARQRRLLPRRRATGNAAITRRVDRGYGVGGLRAGAPDRLTRHQGAVRETIRALVAFHDTTASPPGRSSSRAADSGVISAVMPATTTRTRFPSGTTRSTVPAM